MIIVATVIRCYKLKNMQLILREVENNQKKREAKTKHAEIADSQECVQWQVGYTPLLLGMITEDCRVLK